MMFDADLANNPKHISGHVAIDEQSSHVFALCGQQSMSSIAAMSAISVMPIDFAAILIPAATGSMATEIAMRSAKVVRPTFMAQPSPRKIAGSVTLGSNDEFASPRVAPLVTKVI